MKQMKKIKENLKKQKDKLQKIMSDLEKHIKKFDTRKSGKWKSLKQKLVLVLQRLETIQTLCEKYYKIGVYSYFNYKFNKEKKV
jgi:ribosome-binding ATPase YchF (GTP1/OBG family)